MRAGGRSGRASRGIAEGGMPKTFLICRRRIGVATGRMLADPAVLRDGQSYGQLEAPGVEARVPSPLAQIRKRPVASLTYV